jgi:hypothetical protein
VEVAGITDPSHEAIIKQTARNLTDAVDGFLLKHRHIIMDRVPDTDCPSTSGSVHLAVGGEFGFGGGATFNVLTMTLRKPPRSTATAENVMLLPVKARVS